MYMCVGVYLYTTEVNPAFRTFIQLILGVCTAAATDATAAWQKVFLLLSRGARVYVFVVAKIRKI